MGEAAAGIDVGSSLAKGVLRHGSGREEHFVVSARDHDALRARLGAAQVARLGLTGGGARRAAAALAREADHFEEAHAWAEGARAHFAAAGEAPERFLLVSLGTGTSAVLVEAATHRRVGGSALGGGTLLGLGRALCGAPDYETLAALAARGERARADLTIGDVYPDGEAPLPPQATAANFGRLARDGGDAARREDLAAALVGLVGENTGLLCMGLARLHEARKVVFGGSTLHGNPALRQLLELVCLASGGSPHFPDEGARLGALGALALVTE